VTENAPGRWDRGAFFDVDGTLVATNVVDAYAYYVFHRGTIFGTAQRLLRGLAMAPIYALSDRMNRSRKRNRFTKSRYSTSAPISACRCSPVSPSCRSFCVS